MDRSRVPSMLGSLRAKDRLVACRVCTMLRPTLGPNCLWLDPRSHKEFAKMFPKTIVLPVGFLFGKQIYPKDLVTFSHLFSHRAYARTRSSCCGPQT